MTDIMVFKSSPIVIDDFTNNNVFIDVLDANDWPHITIDGYTIVAIKKSTFEGKLLALIGRLLIRKTGQ